MLQVKITNNNNNNNHNNNLYYAFVNMQLILQSQDLLTIDN